MTTRRDRVLPPMPEPWMYKIAPHVPVELARGMNATPQEWGSGLGLSVTTEEILQCTDRLPKKVRTALSYANHPWAPHWAAEVLWLGYPANAVIDRIHQADREQAIKRKVSLLKGEG